MSSVVRTGVIGVGHFGKFHAEKYALMEDAELVAVADIDDSRANEIATANHCRAETDYRKMFGDVDAVSIASPTASHFEIALDCLENGIHVLVEKPLTDRVEDAERLIAVAAKNNVKLQVGHVERFSGVYTSLAELVTRPAYIECHRISPFPERSTDVSVILDVMIHDIDLILALVDAPVSTVSAIGATVLTTSEDIANARLEFANGCVATITASRVSQKTERKMRIFQPDCYISVDFKELTMARLAVDGPIETHTIPNIDRQEWSYPETDSLALEIAAFVRAIRDNTPVAVDGAAGRDALGTAIKISESLREHRELVEAASRNQGRTNA